MDKRHVLGIVYNPFTEELYSAIEGRGAFLNGKKLTTSKEEGEYHLKQKSNIVKKIWDI